MKPSPVLPEPIDNIHRREAAWLTGVICGCARGLLAGRRHALRDVLEARFGPLTMIDQARLRRLQPTDLTATLRRAASTATIGDVWPSEIDDDTDPIPPIVPEPADPIASAGAPPTDPSPTPRPEGAWTAVADGEESPTAGAAAG